MVNFQSFVRECRKSMSYQAVDGADYMVDEQEMEDFGHEFEEEVYGGDGGELGLDEYDMVLPLLALNMYKCLFCFGLDTIDNF